MSDFIDRAAVERLANELRPTLEGIEAARRAYRSKAMLRFALAIGGGIAVAAVGWLVFTSPIVIILGLMAAVFLSAAWATRPHQAFKDEAAAALIPAVCDTIGGLDYTRSPGGFDGIHRFTEIGVVGSHNRSTYRDRLTGRHRDTDFRMVHAVLKRRKHRSRMSGSGMRSGSSTHTVFKGYLFAISVPKEMPGPILIGRDQGGIGNALGGFFKKFGGMLRVTFDDPEFERRFEVYAPTPQTAQAVIGPGLRETFCLIDDMFRRGGLQAAFDGSDFLMAVRSDETLTDPFTFFSPLQEPRAVVATLVERLTIPCRVIDYLHGDRPADLAGSAP